ncbi:cellulase family glycosylhydrolase [Flavobacterium adhaerens]|uniref:cellulase family glycosylhydrolase n=1 Tax=Flavobacterium adhaerens TaxID=3149043 RepID=UPI0032B3A09A
MISLRDKIIKRAFLLFVLLFYVIGVSSQGFLHREGQKIVDGSGKNIVLRGLGLGGWMVQEGYMIQTGAFAGPQSKIKQKIADVIGNESTEEFYKAYKKNGITKRDIDSLAAWGFNSIRLPMHYNLYTPAIETEKNGQITWLEEGFKMTDDLLSWCAANKMYLILDLHAAPGGQGKDAAISDYDDSKPSLWESAANQDKMVALWEKLAQRYKDNPWIGGYDIINEPNWNFTGTNQNGCDETSNAPLKALMMRITKAIRAIDTNHMIIIEGNCWGNNYNGIFPLWDENMALSFHKYWNTNDTASIQTMLNYRDQYNVPIWLGESGENSNVWFKEVLSLVESNNIGWAFWPMKKIENLAGVTSVTKPEGYNDILEYWKNGGVKPNENFAKKTLMQVAENYKMKNLTIRHDVIDAMFRQVQTNQTKIYKKHSLPGRIFATEFDLGSNGFAYFDKDVANYDGTKFTQWNKGGKMRNDGVDIEECADKISNGYQVSFIEDDEWLQFTVDVKKVNNFDVEVRYASEKPGGKLYLEVDGVKVSEVLELPVSGGLSNWKTVTIKNISLHQGQNTIRVHFEKGNFNLNFLDFKEVKNK